MLEGKGLISIWFFIGILLLVYGILIFAAGIYNLFYPPAQTIVLENLHAAVWWGIFLTLLGGHYTFHFFPKRKTDGKQ